MCVLERFFQRRAPQAQCQCGDGDVRADISAPRRIGREYAALGHAHIVEKDFCVVANAAADLGHRVAHQTGGIAFDQKRARPRFRLRHHHQQLGEIPHRLKIFRAIDQPRAIGLLSRARLEARVFRRLGVVIKAQVGIRLMYGNGGEIQIVVQKLRQEIITLFLGHAQLKPVTRAPRGQHVVVGRADVRSSQLLGDQAGGDVIGCASAAVFLGQGKGAKTQFGAFFQHLPGYAVFPVRLLVELQRDRLDLILCKLARGLLIRALRVVKTNVEHVLLPSTVIVNNLRRDPPRP